MFSSDPYCPKLSTRLHPIGSLIMLMISAACNAEEMSADRAAKELANPAGSLASLANNFIYTSYKGDLPGADSQETWTYTFQPVLPFPVGDKGRRIIFRPLFSLPTDQPVFDANDNDFDELNVNLADTTFDLVYAGTQMASKKRGYLWGVGGAGTIPTATNNDLGGDQWRFGPEVFGGVVREWGLAGALVSHQWNLGGGDGGPGSTDEAFSATSVQYFYSIRLGQGWQILTAPVINYDWKADSDEALSLPLGTGMAKTTKLGKTTWRFYVEAWYFVEQPDSFGADWQISFEIRPVIQNPFIKLFR